MKRLLLFFTTALLSGCAGTNSSTKIPEPLTIANLNVTNIGNVLNLNAGFESSNTNAAQYTVTGVLILGNQIVTLIPIISGMRTNWVLTVPNPY